jgi:hypothetical protein
MVSEWWTRALITIALTKIPISLLTVLLKTATTHRVIMSLINTTGGKIKTPAMLHIMELRKRLTNGILIILLPLNRKPAMILLLAAMFTISRIIWSSWILTIRQRLYRLHKLQEMQILTNHTKSKLDTRKIQRLIGLRLLILVLLPQAL